MHKLVGNDDKIHDLAGLLDTMSKAASHKDKICVKDILEALGSRSLGPLLTLAGIITLMPVIGDIPGVPVLMGSLVLLVSVQLLIGREHPWLPKLLLNRAVSHEKFFKLLNMSRKPARFVDRLTNARMRVFIEGGGQYLIAFVCIAIACLTPLMELVPFSANLAGLALFAFGLALISRDGLLALLALITVLLLGGFLGFSLL
jgi:hypothetical protein